MKRWIVGTAVVLSLIVLAVVGLFLWRPLYFFVAIGAIPPTSVIKTPEGDDSMTRRTPQPGAENLDREVVRIELEGRNFDVPLRYLYGQAFEKHGRWPKPKPGRVKVKALDLSVLLPDLRPYFQEDDARWNTPGAVNRVHVGITYLARADFFEFNRQRLLSGQEDIYYKRTEDKYGLIHFEPTRGGDNRYFAKNEEVKYFLSCIPPVHTKYKTYPKCRARSLYAPGIILDYSYSSEYIDRWEELDRRLRDLFLGFEQAAESTNQPARRQ